MRPITISILFLITLSALADYKPKIFQWTDERGVKHFSDNPENNILDPKKDLSENSLPQQEKTPLLPLAEDNRLAEDKLSSLQGSWIQVNITPSIKEVIGLMTPTHPDGSAKEETTPTNNIISTLTVTGTHFSIKNKLNTLITQTNTSTNTNTANFKTAHTGNLEIYKDSPLDIKGYWSFEDDSTPFATTLREQMIHYSMKTNSKNTIPTQRDSQDRQEQVRIDIQKDILMASIKQPPSSPLKILRIFYKKKDATKL
ncbi:MAG: DUF4124 domain-containing protein [Candidatus Endonucleobacter bathymodioli]|uniref:DUF4124 domain-containing protein n=1 Tax=Candidatus Endonucleibacter bathymodioli TaxID=539814 RepID=A0AA90NLK2_9GAMM|nr:DUF4124 domain-containing protein [Candidatus Endonucleobacter bathymodioli]